MGKGTGARTGLRTLPAWLVMVLMPGLLVVMLSSLVWRTHASHTERELAELSRFRGEGEGLASTLDYFLSERRNDVATLSDSREVQTYFENIALGMSPTYGLLASKAAITELFQHVLEEREIGGAPIYLSFSLLDDSSRPIITQSQAPDPSQPPCPASPRRLGSPSGGLSPELLTALRALSAGEKVALAVDIENGRARLALASPVKVRGRLAGFLVGVLDFEGCLERLFSAVLRSTGRFLCVLGESGVLASLGESQGPAHFPLEAVGQPPGVVATLDMTRDRGAESFLVLDLPVGGASLRLRYLAPSRSVYGLVPPWITSTVISVLCALTLAGLALVWRSNAERLVLNARLAEQARSEADLRQRMEEFRTVFDGLPGMASYKDAQGRYITANRSYCLAMGREPSDFAGRTDDEILPPEIAERMKRLDAPILGGLKDQQEDEIARPDLGEGVILAVRRLALKNTDGTVGGVIALGFDITEKKRMERELRAANEQMELRIRERTAELGMANARLKTEMRERLLAMREMDLVLSSITAILIRLDAAGRVRRWNGAAAQALALPESRATGEALSGLALPWDGAAALACVERCRAELAPTKAGNVSFTRPDGHKGFLMVTASPLLDGAGNLAGVLIMAEDVTDLKLLEAQLSQAQRLESIGQLAAGIAHEINTPAQYLGDNIAFLMEASPDLARILELGQALVAAGREVPGLPEALSGPLGELGEALERADAPFLAEEAPKALERMRDGVERISSIVQAMRRFSHPGGGSRKLVDLNQAIETTLVISRNEWKYVAEAVLELDPGLPQVLCLPGDINQVLLNVVVNAAHAIADAKVTNGEPGRILVRTYREEGWAVIAISDTGTGIPEEVRGQIFNPFFTTKEVGRGTGQGLTIAYDIVVNKHQGTLRFETETGKGTTFFIRLPFNES